MAIRECPLCREQTGAASAVCDVCDALIGPAEPPHGGTCPSCGESIHPLALRCKHCKSDLRAVAETGAQLATRKRRILAKSRHEKPRLPGTDKADCSACYPTLLEVEDGEVVAYDLTDCDDEWCYYDVGPGGVV